jgi:hypothetical protein
MIDKDKEIRAVADELKGLSTRLYTLVEKGTKREWRLPHERDIGKINSLYGPASRNKETALFNWPKDVDVRLYTRNGAHLSDRDGDMADDHRCHPLLVSRLENALKEIHDTLGHDEFIKQGWHIYGGCHNFRPKKGGTGLSMHAWAVAIDENPEDNYYINTETTFSFAAINIMEKWGFLSGGRAWGIDWMHFQAVIPFVSTGSYYDKHDLPTNIIQI